MKIALLGAESTGKTHLAKGLAAHARTQGLTAEHVPEYLREWCDQQGRTPAAHEQGHIAQTQAARLLQASAVDWLIADTTPLITAIYSDHLFGDRSLYDFALAHQRHYDLTLVTALDLPWVADGLQRDGEHVRHPIDALLRAALQRGGIAYAEISGQGELRTQCALRAITASMHAA
jgi:nicotinamide riboside kinase